MSAETSSASTQLVYEPDQKPRSTRDTVIYSLQWIFIMFYPAVWGYAIVGLGLGFQGGDMAAYMARIVLMIGISTVVQVVAGHRFAMVSGPNIIPSLAIVAAAAIGGTEYALHSFNAYIIAGVLVAILGGFGLLSQIGRVWTPLVAGSMVMMVGLSTSSTGVDLIATHAATWPFLVGIALALLAGWLSVSGRGILASIPVLITIVAGYAVFMLTGKFDWEMVQAMPLFSLPKLFPYGLEMPPMDLIVTMFIVNLFAALNTYGNVHAYADIVQRPVEAKTEKRLFSVFGLIEGTLAGILGTPSAAPYGENLGIVVLTRVAARSFILIAGVVMIILSFFGPMAGLMAAMPGPVAGAVLLGVASTLIALGANMWHQGGALGQREIVIAGFSIFLALGISVLPDAFFDTLPRLLATLLKNPVILVIVLVILLEQLVFPKKDQ